MSQYSELMGSFLRTGNFPLEANYIFATEEALKEFYSDPINATTLHKGLLRVVENGGDGQQALYWVVPKQTNDELEFVKLIENIDIDNLETTLEDLKSTLEQEIQDRKDADKAIWGRDDITNIPDDLNSINDLSQAVSKLLEELENQKEYNTYLQDAVQAIAGTEEKDIVKYLQTLPYTSLTEISTALNKFLNEFDETNTQINTLPELLKFLEGFTDSDTLIEAVDKLFADFLGDPLPSKQFRTLRGVEDFVRELKADSENTDANLQTELDQTQVGVGLSGDGSFSPDQETHHLKEATSVMNALKILDGLVNEAINNCNLEVESSRTVNLRLSKGATANVLTAKVKVSTENGNQIVEKDNGIYCNISVDYDSGVLTIRVNGNIISQINFGLQGIVESAQYNSDTESIEIVFKLPNEQTQKVVIPVGSLIREWDVENHENSVIELIKTVATGTGTDKLSADVRLYQDKYQILRKEGNTLYVEGTTDNLTHHDQTLSTVIDALDKEVDTKAPINNPIFTGIVQVQDPPQIGDSSNRIPTTNWVIQTVEKSFGTDLSGHITDYNNPHKVTAEQTGAYSKEETDSLLDKKADLIDGKIPIDQIPDDIAGTIHNEGEWDASTNSPQLNPYDPDKDGSQYIVSTGGEFNGITYEPGDMILNVDGKWYKIDNTDEVTSVNGMKGDVVIGIDDIEGLRQELNTSSSDLTEITNKIEEIQQNFEENINNIQESLDDKADLVEGKIPESQIPDSLKGCVKYIGKYDAANNNPTLTISEPDKEGWYYIVYEPGRQFGLDFKVGDWIVNSGGTWTKVTNSAVTSINGKTGDLILTPDDIEGFEDYRDQITELNVSLGQIATNLSNHIRDYQNPHNVTKEQVGLGNVDNTADKDKPISDATQEALDNKSDVGHTHDASEIVGLDQSPIIKDVVTDEDQLPEDASEGDQYIIMTTDGTGKKHFILAIYKDGKWEQNNTDYGTITSIPGKGSYQLTENGMIRILNANDYKYFYDKLWAETQDLVQSIEWDESTDTQIRLKVTSKKSYAAPNTDEATQPTVEPVVSYINIEKERFLSSAYSRPATEQDVTNGYASKVGVPVLVLELTTGDEVVIDLTDTLNIYDPIDTNSVQMSVSDWTGDASTSYKISSNLKIDSTTNDSSDVKLTINESGLSATLIWGDYD